MAPKVVRVDDWRRFGETVVGNIGERWLSDYIFRGQPDSRFSLSASFDRSFGELPPRQKAEMDRSLLQRFREVAERTRSQLEPGVDLDSDLGQHFGLRTRLLDWSESMYVAAFFAFSTLENRYLSSIDAEADTTRLVSIFALHVDSVVMDSDHIELIVPRFAQANERLRRQRGLFTKNHSDWPSVEGCIQAALAKYPGSDEPPPLVRFDLPVSQVRPAVRDLEQMRISYSELFPGMEGAAKEAMMAEWLGAGSAGRVAKLRCG